LREGRSRFGLRNRQVDCTAFASAVEVTRVDPSRVDLVVPAVCSDCFEHRPPRHISVAARIAYDPMSRASGTGRTSTPSYKRCCMTS